MPEDLNNEFIRGLINMCILYNVFGTEDLSYDPSRVLNDMNKETKSQTKASLEALVQNSEDWQFVRSAQDYDIIANHDAFILTNIDNLSSEEECECFELVGQNTKSKIERIGEKLYLSCNNPITFPKKMFDGSVIYVVSPTIHIEEGQIVGIMRKTPKLDDNKPMTLGLTSATTED